MATVIGSAPLVRELRLKFVDEADEEAIINIPLDGAAVDADIIAIVDDYAALSNAYLAEVTVTDRLAITGYAVAGKPAVTAQPLVAAIFAMEFQKVNPLNAAKTVTKQVLLPAYINAIRDDSVKPHIPTTLNSTLNDLTDLIAANLTYLRADNVYSPGAWAFNHSSKFGTKATVTDGF